MKKLKGGKNTGKFTFNSEDHLDYVGPFALFEDAVKEIFEKVISIFNFNGIIEGEALTMLGVDPNSDVGTIAENIKQAEQMAKKIESTPELKKEVANLVEEGTKVGEDILPDVEDSINKLTDDANNALQDAIENAEDGLKQTGEKALMSAVAEVPVAGGVIDAAITVADSVNEVEKATKPLISNAADTIQTISNT